MKSETWLVRRSKTLDLPPFPWELRWVWYGGVFHFVATNKNKKKRKKRGKGVTEGGGGGGGCGGRCGGFKWKRMDLDI